MLVCGCGCGCVVAACIRLVAFAAREKHYGSEIFAEVGVGKEKSKSKSQEYQRTLELSSKTIKLSV